MGKPIADYVVDDRAVPFTNWQEVLLKVTEKDDFDVYALYNVRQSTAQFLRSLWLEGHTLEISPMVKEEMPFPKFYVAPSEYAKGSYQYCGNDAATKDFFNLNSISPQLDHIVAVNVLEHMEQVWEFPKKCTDLLSEGGRVHIYVPFSLRFHGPSPDLWRFTDTGLKYLMRDFECIRLEAYGPSTKPYGIGASFKCMK